MNGLMLHCGGHPATFDEICSVEVPRETDSYTPVPHGDIVRLLVDEMAERWGLEDPRMQFGLNKKGTQLFGTLNYQVKEGAVPERTLDAFTATNSIDVLSDQGFSIGFRNSYDKTMSVVIVLGTIVFICDNLSYHGSHAQGMRKHSGNAWADLVDLVMGLVRKAGSHYSTSVNWLERLKRHHVSRDTGYEMLGLARGQGYFTPQQFNDAIVEWQKINGKTEWRHQPFQETSYALYQSFTQGLKAGAPRRKLDQYTNASKFFTAHGLDLVEEAEIVG